MSESKKVLIIGIFCSLFLVFLFLWKIILNIDKPLDYSGDVAYNYFILENNFRKISSLDFESLFDTRMYHPKKNTLALGNGYLTQSAIGLPVYIITKNVFISSHFILFFNFFLSFLAVYLLSNTLGIGKFGSILAGIIYTYNPFVLSHFPNHYEQVTLAWIPLIFLVSEKILRKINFFRVSILTSLFLLQLGSSFYYMFFISIIWPIYMGLRIYMERIPLKRFIHPGVIFGVTAFAVLAFLFLRPFIAAKTTYRMERSIDLLMTFSAQPLDFFFTGPTNLLYGWMSSNNILRSFRDPFSAYHTTEHSLFPGFLVYGLLISGIILFIKKRFSKSERKILKVYFIILSLAFILSLGPFVIFYKIIPFADSLRVPSRFMVIGFLAMGIICAFTWQYLSSKSIRLKKLSFFVLCFLVLEYFNILPNPYLIESDTRQFYQWLNSQTDIKVILELPIANSLVGTTLHRESARDPTYLLYSLFHNKKIVNGNNAFVPPDTTHLGNQLSINFPTTAKISMLKDMGVDVVIIHLEEYQDVAYGKRVLDKLRKEGYDEIYSQGTISAFKL